MFQDDWNQLFDDFGEWFGDQVIFVKIDGPNNGYLANHYKAQSYPHFTLLDVGASQFFSFQNY